MHHGRHWGRRINPAIIRQTEVEGQPDGKCAKNAPNAPQAEQWSMVSDAQGAIGSPQV